MDKDDVLAAIQNEELLRPHRRLSEPVNECLDGSDWLNWASVSNGVNLLRKYFDCTCTGDLSSFFSMRCELKNYCFFENEVYDAVVDDRRGVLEKCVTRIGTYDFRVDPDTRKIYELARLAESDEFISGFNVTGTIENVNWMPCGNSLVDRYNLSPREAYGTCNDRERCESFLSDKDFTPEQIEYTCPIVKFNGVECKAFNLVACAESDPLFGIRYTSMPDCSNVLPCMTSSCQAYQRVNEAPERGLFRYPECTDTNGIIMFEPPSTAPSSIPTTLAPSTAPVMLDTPTDAPVTKISTPTTNPASKIETDESSGCVLFSRLGSLFSIVAMILI